MIEKTLSEFGIPAKVVGFRIGPTVTQFAVQPGFIRKGTEEDTLANESARGADRRLQKDLALALSAGSVWIEAPVRDADYVGSRFQIPDAALVRLRPLLEADIFKG